MALEYFAEAGALPEAVTISFFASNEGARDQLEEERFRSPLKLAFDTEQASIVGRLQQLLDEARRQCGAPYRA